MRGRISIGSALVLVISASSTPATACDWDDCSRCGGYYSYSGPAHYYYPPTAYAYAPPDYYAPTANGYYARPAYYASPAYYAPRVYFYPAQPYGYPYVRPYDYDGRGGYPPVVNRDGRPDYITAAKPAGQGTYAVAANHAVRTNSAPIPAYSGQRVFTSSANYSKQGTNVLVVLPTAQGSNVLFAEQARRGSTPPYPTNDTVSAKTGQYARQRSVDIPENYGRQAAYLPIAKNGAPKEYLASRRWNRKTSPAPNG
jgi:hypothetical protein